MPNINTNHIFTIWISENQPDNLNFRCLESWIRLGYDVTVFVDEYYGRTWSLPSYLHGAKLIRPLSQIMDRSLFTLNKCDKILHKIDFLRFYILNKYGGTWLDSDMLLIKRLPPDPIIISSEHTLQSGFKKSKELYKPNIGVLRFSPGHPFTKAVVEKMSIETKEDLKDGINQTSKMLKFIKMLKLKKWSYMNKFVAEPQIYCPVPFPFAKELYTKHLLDVVDTKYNLEFNYIDDSTVGVHLWNNFKKNKFKIEEKDIHPESLYNNLLQWNSKQ